MTSNLQEEMQVISRSIFLVFFLILSNDITGQVMDKLSPLVPAHSEYFQDLPSYPSFCFKKIFRSSNGKLWLIPCTVIENNMGLRLIQFDGYQFQPIRNGLEKLDRTARIIDLYQENILVGFCEEEEEQHLFFYDLSKDQLSIFPYQQEGLIQKISVTEDGRLLIVSETDSQWIIWEWKQEQLHEYQTIPIPFKWRGQKRDPFFQLPFFDEDDFWVWSSMYLELMHVSNTNQSQKIYPHHNFEIPSDLVANEAYQQLRGLIRLTKAPNGLNYVFLRNQLFQIDETTGKVEKMEGFNKDWIPKKAIKDKLGNLVFLFHKEVTKHRAILLDTTGNFFDYSPMLENVKSRNIQDMYSSNFKKEVLLATNLEVCFKTVQTPNSIATYTTMNGARAMAELDTGQFIISLEEPPLRYLDENKGELKVFPGMLRKIVKGPTWRFTKDAKGGIWCGEKSKLVRFDPHTNAIQEYPTDIRNIRLITFLDKDKLALVDRKQLYTFDLTTLEIRTFQENGQPLTFPGVIQDVHYNQDRFLWVATSKGLWKVDLKLGKSYAQKEALSGRHFLSIDEDEKGRLWLGTSLSGLLIFDPDTKSVKILNNTQGLPNNTVVSIVADNEGDRWLGTYEGISLVSSEGELIYNINQEEGLSHSESNRYSYLKASDGQIFMGTIKGFSILDPQKIKQQISNDQELQIYLSSLSYFDKEKKVKVSRFEGLNEALNLKLPAAKRFLQLTVALSNYHKPSASQYAYMLEGLDEDWNYLGKQNKINLNELPPGKYTLLIKGADYQGNWTENPLSIKIHAKDFFYRQFWFYGLLLGIVSTIAYFWIRRLRLEKVRLEAEVKRRTQKIEKDKKVIEEQAKELQQLDELKSRFFTNISHELRTPITLVTAPIEQMIRNSINKLDKNMRNSLQLVLNNGRKLTGLVEELLDLSKLEAQKLTLQETPTPVAVFCRQIFNNFFSKARMARINYQFNAQVPETSWYWIDQPRLEKVISNLLSNALKFTPPNGSVIMSLERINDMVFISVRDTGRGISAEDLPHIFERYFQTKDPNSPREGGTGIGLALSRELTQLMQGSLEVESELGKGSLFTLCLPLRPAPSTVSNEVIVPIEFVDQSGPAPVISAVTQNGGQKPSLLIVEDNLDMQFLINSLLEEEYHCQMANNGAEALETLKSIPSQLLPELIISDIMMPRMDGYALLDHLKQQDEHRDIPVIMLTSKSADEDKLKALRLGVDDYLTKPFSPEELQLRVQKLVRNARERKTFLQKNPPLENIPASADDVWLQELEKAAQYALDKGIDLSKSYLADHMALSERHLLRRLKSLTGLTIQQYTLEAKLQRARRFLENRTYATIAEVAFASGFNSAGYFSRVYEKHFGKRPSRG